MRKTWLLFLISVLFTALLSVFAIESYGAGIDEGSLSFRDPFEPSLPEVQETTGTEIIEDTKKLPGQDTVEEPEEITLPTLTITGVIWNTDRPQAIINGSVVDVGSAVSDVKIISIRETSIDVLYKEEFFTVPVKEQLGATEKTNTKIRRK